jgi:hypothetical protein
LIFGIGVLKIDAEVFGDFEKFECGQHRIIINIENSKKLIKRRHWVVSEPLNLRTFLNHLTTA